MSAPRQFFKSAKVLQPVSTEPLLTLEQVRIKLALGSKYAVYRMIRNYGLPVRLIGGVHRVDPHELEAWTKRDSSLSLSAREQKVSHA